MKILIKCIIYFSISFYLFSCQYEKPDNKEVLSSLKIPLLGKWSCTGSGADKAFSQKMDWEFFENDDVVVLFSATGAVGTGKYDFVGEDEIKIEGVLEGGYLRYNLDFPERENIFESNLIMSNVGITIDCKRF